MLNPNFGVFVNFCLSFILIFGAFSNANAQTVPHYSLMSDHVQVSNGLGRWTDADIKPGVDAAKARIQARCEESGGKLGRVERTAENVISGSYSFFDVYAAPCFYN